ncbi:36603_t:CDS:2, partial [Racocetra persica]
EKSDKKEIEIMSIPKKTKHRYYHLTQQGAELTEKQLEAIRKVVSGYTKKYADGKNKP